MAAKKKAATTWIPAGGGQVVSTAKGVANAQAPKPAPAPAPSPTYVSGEGSIISRAPELYRPKPAAEPATIVEDKKPEEKPPGGETPYDDSALRKRISDLEAAAERDRAAERADASAFLRDILTQYGMEDLAGSVDQLVREWGTSRAVIGNKIRETQSYKDRFKGLLALQQKGVTDIRNEAEYINLESQYRQVFRDNGVQGFLGDAGSKPERDAIAKLVGDYSVSVNEVRDRVIDAQRVVADTPAEVRESLQRYYNIDPATLTQYVLDPTRTSSRINQLANAAIIGGYATRAGLGLGAGAAERVGEFLGGGENLRGSAVEPTLTEIAATQRATERLAQIEQGTLSAEETALGQLGLDVTAQEKLKTLQSRERARFGGTSAITKGTLSKAQSI